MSAPERLLQTLLVEMPAWDWQTEAACADTDPEIFYPEHANQWYVNKIVTLHCGDCPVKAECLTTGWDDPYGIWAGTTGPERERARRVTA